MKVALSWVLFSGLLLGGLASCSDDGGFSDDPACENLSQVQMDEVSDALHPLVSLLSEGVIPEGVSGDIDEEAMEATLTYAAYEGPKSGASFSGVMELSNSVSGSQATLCVDAEFTVSGGVSSSLGMDFCLTLPWADDDFDGPPTDIDGSISLDGTACAAERFPDLNPEEEPEGEPHFLLAGMVGSVPWSEDGASWDEVYLSDVTGVETDLWGIACDDAGLCVLVGAEGQVVIRAADGSWSNTTVGESVLLHDVCTCGGRWLAAGEDGAIFSSQDAGATWSSETSPVQDPLWGVACEGETFFVMGHSGTLLRGTLGGDFVALDVAPNPSPFLSAATDGSGTWIVVGEGGGILRSDDNGSTWSVVAAGFPQHLTHVHHDSGRFIAVGQGPSMGWGQPPVMLISDDGGQSWAEVNLPGDFTSQNRPLGSIVSDGQGRWVAMGNGGDYLLSTDGGASWSVQALDTYGCYDIAYIP